MRPALLPDFAPRLKMIKIRILTTGDIRLVTPVVGHNLIDKGEAEIYTKRPRKIYRDRTMKSKRVGELREETELEGIDYRHRQMRTSR